MMIAIGIIVLVIIQTVVLMGILAAMGAARTAGFQRARRVLFVGALGGAVVVVPAAAELTGGTAQPAPRPVADNCLIVVPNAVIPACGPGLSGGSVSAGAPSQALITLKNWCNLYIGGCSAAFYYPPGPVRRPFVDTAPRHSP